MRKSKEENKIEKTIRGLLKLAENRRCVNCKTLGPQYVCTTFWTFVCTNCSGVHREFSHRVKSISMAKFGMDEVSALQAGGNERAKQVYFKTWDTQRNVFPDNSNIHKLRDFIKHVYVERRFTGETHPALVPRLRNIDDDEAYERRSRDASDKPSSYDRSLDRYGKFSFKEGRSFGYDRENNSRSFNGLRSNSSHIGGIYQVDGARIAGRSATDMFTTADIKSSLSPRKKSPDPPLHHVREILGDNFPRLHVGDHPKPTETRNFYASANNVQQGEGHSKASSRSVDGRPTRGQEGNTQKFGDYSGNLHKRSASTTAQKGVQSSNQTSVQQPPPKQLPKSVSLTRSVGSNQTSVHQENAEVKPKSVSAGSLVNFANFPPPESSLEQEQGTHVINDGGNSSSSQNPAEDTTRKTPAKNTLEYLLFELASPVGTTSNNHSGVFPAIQEAKESPTPSPTPSPQQPTPEHSVINVLDGGPTPPLPSSHSNGVTHNQPEKIAIVPSVVIPTQEKNSAATAEPSTSVVIHTQEKSSAATTEPSTSVVIHTQEKDSAATEPSTSVVIPTQEKNSAAAAEPSTIEARSDGRTELPADLFSSFNPRDPLPGWQMVPSHGMGFNMQYQSASMFPSMLSVQGGLHNMSTPQDMSHTSTFGSDPQAFVPMPSSSYPSGAYLGQQLYSNMPPTRLQGTSGYGGQEGIPGSSNSNQHTVYTYPTNTNMNSFPKSGGNPFG